MKTKHCPVCKGILTEEDESYLELTGGLCSYCDTDKEMSKIDTSDPVGNLLVGMFLFVVLILILTQIFL